MNKELINKYWEEFCHWKDGGKLLGWYNFTNIPNYEPEPWFDFEESSWAKRTIKYLHIIINDEYVEFRKAIAEGKTIESQVKHSNGGGCNYPSTNEELKDDRWAIDSSNTFHGEPRLYRIKPEELKFKVGDLVRHEDTSIGVVKCVITLPRGRDVEVYWKLDKNGSPLTGYNVGEHKSSKLTPWQPQVGEWVVYYITDSSFHVGKYIEEESNGHIVEGCEYCVNLIEPFIGTLPTHLKGK